MFRLPPGAACYIQDPRTNALLTFSPRADDAFRTGAMAGAKIVPKVIRYPI